MSRYTEVAYFSLRSLSDKRDKSILKEITFFQNLLPSTRSTEINGRRQTSGAEENWYALESREQCKEICIS